MKNHSCNLHAPLCGIFHPNSVVVARYDALIRQNLPQIVTHILQKAFFKHALGIWNNLSTNEQETVMSMLRGLRK